MIVCGCLAAFIARRIPRPLPDHIRRIIGVLGALGWVLFAAVLLFAARFPFFTMFGSLGYQIALWSLVPMILDLYFRQQSLFARGLAWHRAQWVGQRSYGIYLWHIPVLLPFLAAIESSYGARKLALGLVASALGVIAGLLSFRYIERRFLRIKETRFTAPQDRLRSEMAAGEVADPGPGEAPAERPTVDVPQADRTGPSAGIDQRP
jgi:peptidoglycan/LPS O-acetylase OafA/YrhL